MLNRSIPVLTLLWALGAAAQAEPDCTITIESEVSAGSAGHAASVADAGVGATYDWNIAGGIITGGAGTPEITYTAGPAGTLTLGVTVVAGTSCSDSADVTVNAVIILNEYNAVSGSQFLESGGTDTFWGRVLGNGDDWFELVVIADHLDMRGWQLVMSDSDHLEDLTLYLTSHEIWSDLRSGTIITVSEELANNADEYAPEIGRWWLNVKAADGTSGSYITASNFWVNNDNWQLTIRDLSGVAIYGPAGEGIQPTGGVGSDEVCKLEEDPSTATTPLSSYNDGGSSTFGSPNVWDGGASSQDLAALRSVVPYYPLVDVRINEVLTHTDPPFEDWIEIHNASDAPVDIGGWYLSDDLANLTMFQIPEPTVVDAHGYVAFSESEFGFGLNSSRGDEVYLSEADAVGVMTGGRDFVEFGPAPNGVSFGRFPNGTGPLYAMSEQTREEANAYPLVGPVVINEIMYRPPDLPGGVDNVDHEYVELHNVTDSPVGLFTFFPGPSETHAWRLTGGVSFTFSLDTIIPPHGYLIVVSFDPVTEPIKLADFLAAYGLDGSEPLVGPYSGKLRNTGESVELRKPDTPQPAPEYFVPYVLVEDVPYTSSPPWPIAPAGLGPSLERIVPTLVGNVPTNWRASSVSGPTPGRVNTCPLDGDFDGDGDVDLNDFGFFAECVSAPGGGLILPCCTCLDFDGDDDVDLSDFAEFQTRFSG